MKEENQDINTENIIEFSKGQYLNFNTGLPATKEEIDAFKRKVLKNKADVEERVKNRNDKNRAFVDQHKNTLKELLGTRLADDKLYDYDIEQYIYQLTTALFDCFGTSYMDEFLKRIKEESGEDIYYAVIEGYVYGRHDT